MNRAPSKNDTWWSEHLRTCEGTYTKIKEPEDYGKKNSKRKRDGLSETTNIESSGKLVGGSDKKHGLPGQGKALGDHGSGNISKWFKPASELSNNIKAVSNKSDDGIVESSGGNQKKPIIPDRKSDSKNIQTINSVDNKSVNNSHSIFAGSGHTLGGGIVNNSKGNARNAWLDRLTKNHRNAAKTGKKEVGTSTASVNPWSINSGKSRGNVREPRDQLETSTASVNPGPINSSKSRNNVREPHDQLETYDGAGFGRSINNRLPRDNERVQESHGQLVSNRSSGIETEDCSGESGGFSRASSSTVSPDGVKSAKMLEEKAGIHPSTGSTVALPTSLSTAASPSKTQQQDRGFKILSTNLHDISPQPKTVPPKGTNNSIPRKPESGKPSCPIFLDDSPQRPALELVECPVCPKRIPAHKINIHLDECLSSGS